MLRQTVVCLFVLVCVSVCARGEQVSQDAHLQYKHVQHICQHRDQLCGGAAAAGAAGDAGGGAEPGRPAVRGTRVCAVRMQQTQLLQERGVRGSSTQLQYAEYENSCFLFVDNLCWHYGNEYAIAWSGSCEEYARSRRSEGNDTRGTVANGTQNSKDVSLSHNECVLAPGLQCSTEAKKQAVQAFSPLYDVDTAFDYHTCPLSCPQVYSPVCIGVNRGLGHYYKFFTFINHCAGDLYYCRNWREFSPPPDEEELVKSSPLSWSYCAANRYIQFARFTELMSSMGHYGWLSGDYRATHIMQPGERKPGYG